MSVNKYEKFGSRGFSPSSNTDGNGEGDVVNIGGGSEEYPVVQGRCYYLNGSGYWSYSDADAAVSSTSLLAIALGSGDPGEVGMLLRGMVSLSVAPGAGCGIPLYLSNNSGQITRVAPSGASDYVRVIGYKVTTGAEDKKIWFNPDNTWIEISEG
jgi:hypothetical protein